MKLIEVFCGQNGITPVRILQGDNGTKWRALMFGERVVDPITRIAVIRTLAAHDLVLLGLVQRFLHTLFLDWRKALRRLIDLTKPVLRELAN